MDPMDPVTPLTPLNTSALPKILGAALAAVAAFLASAPAAHHLCAAAAVWLFVGDYVTGIGRAALKGGVSSSEMRHKTREKLWCYFQILVLGYGVGLLAQSWLWPTMAWGAFATAEAWSNVENLRDSAKAPALAPVRAFADAVVALLKHRPAGLPASDAAPEAADTPREPSRDTPSPPAPAPEPVAFPQGNRADQEAEDADADQDAGGRPEAA